MIGSLRASLFEELPDFGRHLGYDGKAIESHSTGRIGEGEEHASDPDADWGKHESAGVNGKTGAIWKKVKSWFGYGLHLIADTHYEVPVAFEVTRASGSEAARDAGGVVREGAGDGRSLRGLQRRPRSRQRPPEGAAAGQVDHPPADRHAADVAGREEGSGL